MGEVVKLIGTHASFICTRVEWALKIKGVEYEYMEEDLLNKSPNLVKFNPVHKKVPVLVHGGQPIAESLIIIEYIDEKWKHNPLLPQDPYQRAMARFWAKFSDDKCLHGAWDACKAEGEEKEKAIESAREPFWYLEKEIYGKKFFGGEDIGYLDLVVGWITLWLGVMEECGGNKTHILDPHNFPCLHQWAENFEQISMIKESLPPRDLLVNYFHGSLAYVRSLAANAATKA